MDPLKRKSPQVNRIKRLGRSVVHKNSQPDKGKYEFQDTPFLTDSYRLLTKVGTCVHPLSFLYYFLTGPGAKKLFSCSTQLIMKFIQLRNVKMPTIVGIFNIY